MLLGVFMFNYLNFLKNLEKFVCMCVLYLLQETLLSLWN